MNRILRIGAGAAAALSLLLFTALAASAHAVLTVGTYRVAIGWEFEPASGTSTYIGYANAIQVFVDVPTASNPIGTPVSDLNQDCSHPDIQVTVKVGSTTSSPFCPMPAYDPDTGNGRMDEYDSELIPTVVGDYTFHIFGSIHGTSIDQTVTSGPSTFDSVADPSTVEFPVALPPQSSVVTKVDAVDQRASDALSTAQSAKDSGGTGTVLGVVALIVAVVLGGTSIAVSLRRRA